MLNRTEIHYITLAKLDMRFDLSQKPFRKKHQNEPFSASSLPLRYSTAGSRIRFVSPYLDFSGRRLRRGTFGQTG